MCSKTWGVIGFFHDFYHRSLTWHPACFKCGRWVLALELIWVCHKINTPSVTSNLPQRRLSQQKHRLPANMGLDLASAQKTISLFASRFSGRMLGHGMQTWCLGAELEFCAVLVILPKCLEVLIRAERTG